MANSGYGRDQVRKIVIGGLTGYERKVSISKDRSNPRWRPLHDSAASSSGRRSRKKLLAKTNWFKGKRKDMDGELEENKKSNAKKPRLEPLGVQIVDQGGAKERGRGAVPHPCPKVGENGRNDTSDRSRKKGKEKSKLMGDRKRKGEHQKSEQEPPTISVMFVEQTVGGELARRLKESEDRISKLTGYRVRMVETGGSRLCHMLPNTNPWAGAPCGRPGCYMCEEQGEEKILDCKRRNILYESSCTGCRKTGDTGKGDRLTEGAVYVGETARSLFERTAEHWRDGQTGVEDSHICTSTGQTAIQKVRSQSLSLLWSGHFRML